MTVVNGSSATALGLSVVDIVPGSAGYYQGNAGLLTTTLGNGNLRLAGVNIPVTCTIQALFAEFTAAGDAPSLFATALYSDSGNGRPGQLLITGPTISTGTGNAGSVATGGTPGVYAGAVAPTAIPPGLYWIGGVTQGVTTTQPTMRCASWAYAVLPQTSVPVPNSQIGAWSIPGITGALPPSNPLGAGWGAGSVAARVGFQIV